MSYYKGRIDFGLTQFNRPIPEQEQEQLLTREVRSLFKSRRWTIQQNGFQLKNWHRVLSSIKECPAQDLTLAKNGRKQMLVEILHISFPKLTILNLSFNQISSIEKICGLNAPNLERLDLSRNFIASLRPLRKAILPKLKSVRLYANKIRELSSLSELKTGYYFSNFNVQEHLDEQCVCQDLSWTAKIEPQTLSFLELASWLRVRQVKKMQMIKQRYPQAEMKRWTYMHESQGHQEEQDDIGQDD